MSEYVTSPLTANPLMATSRVNLFTLYAEGIWEHHGTGHCAYKSTEDDEGGMINVTSEGDDDTTTLLNAKVLQHTEYHRPQENLIVWTEENNLDVALVFEDPGDCENIWQKLHKAPDNDDSDDATTLPPDSDDEDTPSDTEDCEEGLLPFPEPSNLSQIANRLVNATDFYEQTRLASFIIANNFIGKLNTFFDSSEALGNVKDLHKLCTIMKAIIKLNESDIIKHILRDDNYLGVMGMLEYNPATPTIRSKHREFLAQCDAIQPVVRINDDRTNALIHKSRRMKYLKEIMSSDSRDVSLESDLQSMISSYDRTIINNIMRDTELLFELFGIFKDPNSTAERKIDASKFALQLCTVAKKSLDGTLAKLYRTLCHFGFLDMFTFALAAEPEDIRTYACNVLCSVVEADAAFMRTKLLENVTQNGSRNSLMQVILERLTLYSDRYLKMELFEIVRLLLDVANGSEMDNEMTIDEMRKRDQDSEEFIYMFFDDFATTIFLRPFDGLEKREIKLDGPLDTLELTMEQGNIFGYICELLCLVVKQHSFESRKFITNADIFTKVAQLYRCNQAVMKHAALKFFRACVGVKDSFYQKKLVRSNAFEPTIRLLLDTGGRNNLLNSACLELFEFIRKENIILFVNHLITNFGSVLDKLTYISTFEELRLRYEQNKMLPNFGGWSPSSSDEEDPPPPPATVPSESPTTPIPSLNYEGYVDFDEKGEEREETPGPMTMTPPFKENRTARQDMDGISAQDVSSSVGPQQILEKKRKRDGEDDADDKDDAHTAKFIKC